MKIGMGGTGDSAWFLIPRLGAGVLSCYNPLP